MRILVVEDDPVIQKSLLDNLAGAGYQPTGIGDGLSALRACQETVWDLVILDGHLPALDGLEVLARLRARDNDVPVLMLTGRGAEVERLRGFDAGADDYLAKPYSTMELLARIRAILKRSRGAGRPPSILRSGPYRLDTIRLEATKEGTPLQLLPKEAQLMEAFMRRPQVTLSREELLDLAWPVDSRPAPRTVDAHVARLRRKLDDDVLLTLAGEGYRWTQSVEAG